MRCPNDKAFHLRMAALLIVSLFFEHLASTRLPNWSSPRIGIVTFVLGIVWVGAAAFHASRAMQDRIRVLEDRLDRVTRQTEALEEGLRAKRSLPPM
jgi:hypothetical protein